MGIVPRDVCAATVIATDESTRVSSSTAIAYETVSEPAPVLLRYRHTHQAQPGELGDELVREALLAVELLGNRRDALLRELAHGLADELLLGGEVQVHGAAAMLSEGAATTRRRALASIFTKTLPFFTSFVGL